MHTCWVFDLDNTLYPRTTGLTQQMDRQLGRYLQQRFDLDPPAAEAMRQDLSRRFGTTLRGLIEEHDFDPRTFVEFEQDIDYSALVPDPVLVAAMSRLPGQKYILTNATRRHAVTVLGTLGLPGDFAPIFDIVDAGFLPKPDRRMYDLFLDRHGVQPEHTVMVEDIAANLVEPKALGMTTVLVDPTGGTVAAGQVDHVTDDLPGFLDRWPG
ncbi:HAD family hydrolase [Flindersiella endophytica]